MFKLRELIDANRLKIAQLISLEHGNTIPDAMGEVARGLAALKRDGSVRESLPRMQTRKELYSLLGYVPGEQWNFPNDR